MRLSGKACVTLHWESEWSLYQELAWAKSGLDRVEAEAGELKELSQLTKAREGGYEGEGQSWGSMMVHQRWVGLDVA